MAKKTFVGVGLPQTLSKNLEEQLNPGLFEFVAIPSAQDLMANLANLKVDIMFLYNDLPDLKNYEELCIALRSDQEFETVPVIVISKDEQQPRERIRMLNSGLIDGFVNSTVLPEELAAYANVFLQRRALEEELEQKNALLNQLSITDELTKLFNRRYLIETLNQEINKLKRYDYNLSCIMFDIDHYKRINDEMGHNQGDLALENLAQLIRKNIRTTDIACRYGGDEMVVLFPFTDFESSFIATERIRKKVESANFGTEELPLRFTISIGLVSLGMKTDIDVDRLLAMLDKQLYEAKNSGRNRICGIMYKPPVL